MTRLVPGWCPATRGAPSGSRCWTVRRSSPAAAGEKHGISVFRRDGERVPHTYSAYGRGVELMLGTYHPLDLTPLGRQLHVTEFRHHDRYATAAAGHCH